LALLFSSRGRHTSCYRDWSSDVCSSNLEARLRAMQGDLLRARERAESVQAEVTKAKVNAAALAERREGVARSLQRMQEQRSEVRSEERRVGRESGSRGGRGVVEEGGGQE